MEDFLAFRKMVTPVIIQVLFWLGVAGVVLMGLSWLFSGYVLMGALQILLGPIVVRIYCELLIVVFRINSNLTDIRATVCKDETPEAGEAV